MEADTMASGETEWPMDRVDSFTLKVMFMKENGLTIKPTDMVFILILTEVVTKANGTKINNMDLVLNNGQMVLNTKVNMNRE
jgi:hypothetical protein